MSHSAGVTRTVDDEATWETIVSAVAETTGRDPLAMEPIYNAIDPEALDAVFAETAADRSPRQLRFTYAGCEVEVTDDGLVRVEATEQPNVPGGVA